MLILSGCATVQSPVSGLLYTNAKGGVGITGLPIGSVRGEACATTILGLIGTGDASVKAAAASAGITRVTLVDHTSNSILGVYGKYCTVVYGVKGKMSAKAAPAAAAPKAATTPAAPAGAATSTDDLDF